MPSYSRQAIFLPSNWPYNNVLYGGAGMTTETAKFTLRIDTELLKKFRFVADYNARSANRELEVLMKKHIAEFEKENGKITFDWFDFSS